MHSETFKSIRSNKLRWVCTAVAAAIGLCAFGCTPSVVEDPFGSVAGDAQPGGDATGSTGGVDGAQGGQSGHSGSPSNQNTGGSSGAGANSGTRLLATDGNKLVELNLDSKSVREIGGDLPDAMLLAWGPNQTLYGVTRTIIKESALYEIDSSNGASALIGTLVDTSHPGQGVAVSSFGSGPGGTLYVNLYNGGLMRVDPQTAEAFPTAVTHDILENTFTGSGELVARNRDAALEVVDFNTGAILGTRGAAGSLKLGGITISYLRAMCTTPEGRVFALARPSGLVMSEIWEIDPQSGAATFVARTSRELNGLAPRP